MSDLDIWRGLAKLHEMIVTPILEESAYQTFFEANGWAFEALGFNRYASFEKKSGNSLPYNSELGYQPEPDFIIANAATGEVQIFELKRPDDVPPLTGRSTDGNRQKFRATVESYVSQCVEYVDFIAGNADARRVVCEVLGIEKISSVSAILVYGYHYDNRSAVAKLASNRVPRISLIDYSLLLEKLVKLFGVGRRDAIPEPGFSYEMIFTLAPVQKCRRAYIFDVGRLSKNRLSMMVYNGKVVVRILDQRGQVYAFSVDAEVNILHAFRVECSTSEKGKLLQFFVDNVEIEAISSTKRMDIGLDPLGFVVGSDVNGKNGGCFKIVSSKIFGSTTGYQSRLEMDVRYNELVRTDSQSIMFGGSDSMRIGENGALQATEGERPSLSASMYY